MPMEVVLPAKKRFLCVAPHPDDAELGMGGTLIKLRQQGHEVLICDMTNGEPTPNGSPELREKEWTKASEIMGVERVNLRLKNREVQHTIEARHRLAGVMRQFRPEVVFIPYYPDAHPDHIATHRIAIDARFDAKLSKSGISGEPHHPKRLIQYYCTHLRTHIVPTFCIDVSDTFETKMQACGAYESQGLGQEGNLSAYVRDIHAYFGGRVGCAYAEPFYSDELIGLSGLSELM